MSYCKAQVLLKDSQQNVEVVFSTAAQFSYISEALVQQYGLEESKLDQTRTAVCMAGSKLYIKATVTAKLKLKEYVDEVTLMVVPGGADCVVLGTDWMSGLNAQFQRAGLVVTRGSSSYVVSEDHANPTTRLMGVWWE